ncbi:hypothetical protein [Leucobacter massiliensis]|uniref:Lipoprotein n=1 Tax=Leucobacter massiliensis TaxID=1686285 RepID=A0A2S9QM23_9MICO|nr:hypothetical protein [Leucobacter massiliensis]PRI10634.1 hypothetical protein B4915_06910 [Leucobacter massiliensis]
MTRKKTMFKAAGTVGAALLTLSLASCAGGQSVAEACQIAEDTMTEVVSQSQADTQQALQDAMQGEDIDLGATLQPVLDALGDAQKKVTNAEVKDALDGFVDEYQTFADTISAIDLSAFQELSDLSDLDPSDPEAMAKLDELQQKSQELQQKSQELQTELNERTEALTSASSKLEELCSK